MRFLDHTQGRKTIGRTPLDEYYIRGSVHRKSRLMKSNKMQQYADIYLLQIYSKRFGCLPYPSSGVHKTLTAASGTGHTIWGVSFLQRNQISPYAYWTVHHLDI